MEAASAGRLLSMLPKKAEQPPPSNDTVQHASRGAAVEHMQQSSIPLPPLQGGASSSIDAPVPSTSTSADADYDGLTFVAHMIAGGVAGTVEHTFMYPVDTIKTRMQALSHPGQRLQRSSIYKALQTALRREGIGGLYKGVGAVAAGAGPAHALHFAVYEYMREALGGNRPGQHPLLVGLSGALATVVNDAIMTPVDVIKQRLQVAHTPYQGVLDCARRIYHQEGVRPFFRSYRTTLVMNIPFTAVHFAVYDSAKKWLMGTDTDDSLAVQLVAGGLAGGCAAAVTTPFDVVKTRLQTEGVHSATRYNSTAVLPIMRKIMQEEGAQALWKGVKPRVLFHVPAAAVCWGTYETMKSLLQTA